MRTLPNSTALDKFCGLHIVSATSALGTYLYNPVGLHNGFQNPACIHHAVGKRFFDIDITAGFHRLTAMVSMLKICRGADYRIDVFHAVEFIGVAGNFDIVAGEVFYKRFRCIASLAPDIADCGDFHIQVGSAGLECLHQRAASSAHSNETYTHPVIGPQDTSWFGCHGKSKSSCPCRC